jgi:hypothetical protein
VVDEGDVTVEHSTAPRWLITFGGREYDAVTEQVVRDAPKLGVDEVFVFDDVWLRQHDFFEVNRWLWDVHSNMTVQGRGFGWYSWKPLVLLEALDKAPKDAVVLFIDADTRPIADLGVIYETAQRDGAMFFAASGHQNQRWCTRDCLVVMGQDRELLKAKHYPHEVPEAQLAQHAVARFVATKKGPWRPRQLLLEWLAYAVNPMATTFEPSVLGPEHPDFTEHRTEQAILTNLVHKHGYKLHREACEAGNGFSEDRQLFGQLFTQHHTGGPSPATTGSRFRRIP